MKPNNLPLVSKTVETLLKMRQALLDRPESRFDMRQWAQRSSCGTVCCLLGSYVEKYGDETEMYIDWGAEGAVVRAINGEEISSAYSAAQLVGISYTDALRLFLPLSYNAVATKKKVLRRLNQMIAKYSK